MRFFFRLIISVSVIACASNTLAKPITIIVVTNDAHPISNVQVNARIINLDRAEQLHEQLSANLPKNPESAVTVAKSRISIASNDIQLALQDVVDAWGLGVAKVPAVVIGNKVVYGVSDIGRAVSLIKGYEEQSK